jgi:hypothetical protein
MVAPLVGFSPSLLFEELLSLLDLLAGTFVTVNLNNDRITLRKMKLPG